MSKRLLLTKYGNKVGTDILIQYKDAEKVLWVNTDDKDLTPITIDLPEAPEWSQIDNFGLPAKDQYFRPPVIPKRLKDLQKKLETIDEIWNELYKYPEIYYDEIQFIKKAWYHRLYGYWFYNNGVPTYIDGWHYFFIAWWNIDVGLPKYRSRDRKFFLFARKIYTETESFVNIDEDSGLAIPDSDGSYARFDTGRRVFYGSTK